MRYTSAWYNNTYYIANVQNHGNSTKENAPTTQRNKGKHLRESIQRTA